MAAADAFGEPGMPVAPEGSPEDVGPVGTTGAQPPANPATMANDATATTTDRDQCFGDAGRRSLVEPTAS